jgi:hypothetical protein
MSLASGILLSPRPYFCSTTVSVTTNASQTPTSITFAPTFADGYLTTAGLTQISVAQWNALQIQNFLIRGDGNGATPLIYELNALTPVAPVSGVVQPSSLTFYATPLTATAVTTPAYITFNI